LVHNDEEFNFSLTNVSSLISGSTYTDPNQLKAKGQIYNESGKTVKFVLKVEVVEMADGHTVSTTFNGKTITGVVGGSFYSPISLGHKETSDAELFKSLLNTNNQKGKSRVRYKFIPLNSNGTRAEYSAQTFMATWTIY
jgi:hypothetical protein